MVATWVPWFAYALTQEEKFDAETMIELLIIPALGLLLPASEMAYENGPAWVQPIINFVIESTVYNDWEWVMFLWLLPVAALLWAMTILGARGKWSLAIVFTIGLAFQVVSIYIFHTYY